MLFNSLEFVLFFIIVYFFYKLSNHKWQNRILLLASYIFYGSWDWRFLSLIFLSTLVDYFCGKKIYNSSVFRHRKIYLLLSLLVNLGALGFFKYFNFFSENLQTLFSTFGLYLDKPTLRIILPVGISFYTFQTLSYTIDIYRNKFKPEKNFFDFALFVSFFPQLVAGPIERTQRLLPQIKSARLITHLKNKQGFWLISWGFFLKIFVADNMAKIVDLVFAETAPVSGFEVIMGSYAFAFQIFGDFAGYSFIAIGIAKLLGFDLMTNFLFPYFSTNPGEFWKNWHISLSTWLRDYLYIPLGGNRKGRLLTYRNLFLTMLLGGLWHGAAWTFILWGAYHGAVLIIFKLLNPLFVNIKIWHPWKKLIHAFKIFFMFQLICLGWIMFRSDSIKQFCNLSYNIVFNIRMDSKRFSYYFLQILFYSCFMIIVQLIQKRKNSMTAIIELKGFLPLGFYIIMFYLLIFWGEFGGKQFIYFQF